MVNSQLMAISPRLSMNNTISLILMTVPKSLLKEADPNFFQTTTVAQETTKTGKYI